MTPQFPQAIGEFSLKDVKRAEDWAKEMERQMQRSVLVKTSIYELIQEAEKGGLATCKVVRTVEILRKHWKYGKRIPEHAGSLQAHNSRPGIWTTGNKKHRVLLLCTEEGDPILTGDWHSYPDLAQIVLIDDHDKTFYLNGLDLPPEIQLYDIDAQGGDQFWGPWPWHIDEKGDPARCIYVDVNGKEASCLEDRHQLRMSTYGVVATKGPNGWKCCFDDWSGTSDADLKKHLKQFMGKILTKIMPPPLGSMFTSLVLFR